MNEWQARAEALDAADSLRSVAATFELPDGTVYLDGNSLGALPKTVKPRMLEVIEQQWGQDLISSWNKHQWIDLAHSVGAKLAPLLGVKPTQVVACDSISVNLFKLLNSALAQRPERKIVLSAQNNFPTDLYVAQGVEQLLGSERCKLTSVAPDALHAHLTADVAVLMLTQVDFRSGALLDMQALTAQAHAHGTLVIWDLAHSAGVVPLQLNACDVDFAVGCGYKFLNGGPGAPAFMSVNERYLSNLNQPIQGWMGHAQPFEFATDYHPAPNIKQLLTGTPAILSLAAFDAALEVYRDIDVTDLRQKSLSLSCFYIELFDPYQSQHAETFAGFRLNARLADAERGSHVALEHDEAYPISQALIAHNVIIDFRAPNLIRFGFAPLYNSHQDVLTSLQTLHWLMQEEVYLEPVYQHRKSVT